MPINIGDDVLVHYTLKLESGDIIETTRKGEPFLAKIGSHDLLPELERVLIGLDKGDIKEVQIPPSKGYGERREGLLHEIPKSRLTSEHEPSKNMFVDIFNKDGNRSVVTIHDVKEDSVVLDLNHHLAGRTLVVDIEVVDILSGT
jgi:FKBP-type peptidyl-prolyl cis-trans isomerase 2